MVSAFRLPTVAAIFVNVEKFEVSLPCVSRPCLSHLLGALKPLVCDFWCKVQGKVRKITAHLLKILEKISFFLFFVVFERLTITYRPKFIIVVQYGEMLFSSSS